MGCIWAWGPSCYLFLSGNVTHHCAESMIDDMLIGVVFYDVLTLSITASFLRKCPSMVLWHCAKII